MGVAPTGVAFPGEQRPGVSGGEKGLRAASAADSTHGELNQQAVTEMEAMEEGELELDFEEGSVEEGELSGGWEEEERDFVSQYSDRIGCKEQGAEPSPREHHLSTASFPLHETRYSPGTSCPSIRSRAAARSRGRSPAPGSTTYVPLASRRAGRVIYQGLRVPVSGAERLQGAGGGAQPQGAPLKSS
ncbi:hypothetical protein NDU88_002995 [Pleurodeles waltl]|uniref:Uncharacterized protein n=1 Tax=Pleurodeles waltl TaxID=8319 RepID=A0AAV7KUB3_PLEWA|nr:hypothetical protein NDU88_002995 [Pleurodeles waltl]